MVDCGSPALHPLCNIQRNSDSDIDYRNNWSKSRGGMMPDLSKCEGKDCPLRNDCYRYTCEPYEYLQSWLAESPYDKEKGTCTHQMYVRKEKIK